jgi:hypothetical protein
MRSSVAPFGGLTATRVYRGSLVGLAAGAALLPAPARIIERWYSQGLYPVLQPAVTAASNLTRFALLDAFIAVVIAAWLVLAVMDLSHRGWFRAIFAMAWRTLVWASALYLVFLLVWGLNYRRAHLKDRLAFDGDLVTPAALQALAKASVARVNALHHAAHAAGWAPADRVDPVLAEAFARANREIGGRDLVVGRPKTTMLDWYFRRASVDGMTDPFFLETLVPDGLLPFERPFIFAHEWSHLAGIADEGEANFLGWVACLHGRPPDQYSGWLFLVQQIQAGLPGRDRAVLRVSLDAGPLEDLTAIAARVARTASPRIAAAGWRAYDSYLKANRIQAGAASYSEVVRLILGVSFGPDWMPLRRASSL